MKNKKASSFHEFARNTSDAWDIGDDEEEDFSSPPFQTLNSKVALATAAQVLENHSKLRVKPERSQSTTSDVSANYKVIKSSSDAQLSRNSSESILSLCNLSVECSQRGKGSPQAPTQFFCGMVQNKNPQARGLLPARWLSLPFPPLIAALFP